MIAHLVVAMDAATVEAGSQRFQECAKVRLKSIRGSKPKSRAAGARQQAGVREYAEAFPDRMPRFFVGIPPALRPHALPKKAMAAIASVHDDVCVGKAKNMAKIRCPAARPAVENNIKLRVGVPVVKFTESGNIIRASILPCCCRCPTASIHRSPAPSAIPDPAGRNAF
jgi:hypothetical protein